MTNSENPFPYEIFGILVLKKNGAHSNPAQNFRCVGVDN